MSRHRFNIQPAVERLQIGQTRVDLAPVPIEEPSPWVRLKRELWNPQLKKSSARHETPFCTITEEPLNL